MLIRQELDLKMGEIEEKVETMMANQQATGAALGDGANLDGVGGMDQEFAHRINSELTRVNM